MDQSSVVRIFDRTGQFRSVVVRDRRDSLASAVSLPISNPDPLGSSSQPVQPNHQAPGLPGVRSVSAILDAPHSQGANTGLHRWYHSHEQLL